MARRAPSRPARNTHDDDDADSGMSNFSDGGDDDGEEDEEEEDDGDDGEDRGDDHDDPEADDNDGEDDGDDDGEEDEGEEGEEEEEEDGEEEEEADPDDLEEIANSGRGSVPIARLNEVLEQNRKLTEALLLQAGGGQKPAARAEEAPTFDLKAKLKERNAKILEGDDDAATAIDLEIEEYRQKVATAEATKIATGRVTAAMAEQETSAAIARVQRDYPVLNDKTRAFDSDKLDEVVALRNVYMARGMSMGEAIAQAARRVCGKPASGKAGGNRERARDPEERTTRERRIQHQRARNQPGNLNKAGMSARQVADTLRRTENVSERQVRQMTEQEKRRERGDFDVGPRRGRRSGR